MYQVIHVSTVSETLTAIISLPSELYFAYLGTTFLALSISVLSIASPWHSYMLITSAKNKQSKIVQSGSTGIPRYLYRSNVG